MKKFCINGPVIPEKHYFLPISDRIDVAKFDSFIESMFYFVVHAPRQSGKTSTILQYVDYVNKQGQYTAFYLSVKCAHKESSVDEAFTLICKEWLIELSKQLPQEVKIREYLTDLISQTRFSYTSIISALRHWSQHSEKPLVVFWDEIDGLEGDVLIPLLKQIRPGFPDRPKWFPQSMGFMCLGRLRDYAIKSSYRAFEYGPFNIIAESVRLPDFTLEDISNLYQQHTIETGQIFTDEATELAFCLTQGQPWLVNALAYEACFKDVTDRSQPITVQVIERAKKALILRRDTHLDALSECLHDSRVRPIIDAIISGRLTEWFEDNDLEYTRGLGLIKQDELCIANPIYQEIIPRELTHAMQHMIPEELLCYVDTQVNLDTKLLLERFTQFYCEHSCELLKDNDYKESGPYLMLMAWLQRIVSGGGEVQHEYTYGHKYVDILVLWKEQRIVIESKIVYNAQTIPEGIAQTVRYMDICGATEGHLVIFDRNPDKSWEEKIAQLQEHIDHKTINIWQM